VLHWITCAIILHNLIIYVEGEVSGAHFQPLHSHQEEEEDVGNDGQGPPQEGEVDEGNPGEIKRCQLTAKLLQYCQLIGIPF
jgi:hypothetical protein